MQGASAAAASAAVGPSAVCRAAAGISTPAAVAGAAAGGSCVVNLRHLHALFCSGQRAGPG